MRIPNISRLHLDAVSAISSLVGRRWITDKAGYRRSTPPLHGEAKDFLDVLNSTHLIKNHSKVRKKLGELFGSPPEIPDLDRLFKSPIDRVDDYPDTRNAKPEALSPFSTTDSESIRAVQASDITL